DRELELALGGLNIAWIFWIPWVHPVTVQGDTNLSTNLILELLTVDLHSVTMGNQERVTSKQMLAGGVTLLRLGAVGASSWSVETNVVTEDSRAPWFVEGNPVLDLWQAFKHEDGVSGEVGNELILVEEAEVAIMESLWQVPVELCDEWDD